MWRSTRNDSLLAVVGSCLSFVFLMNNVCFCVKIKGENKVLKSVSCEKETKNLKSNKLPLKKLPENILEPFDISPIS